MFLWALGRLYILELALLFSLDKHPGVEVLDHIVVLFLFFKLLVSLLLSFPPQPPKPDRIPVYLSPPKGAASFLSNWGRIRLQDAGIIPLLIWGGQSGENLHTAFHRGCTNLYYYQQCTKILCSPHPHQPLLFLLFLMTALVRWFAHLLFWFAFYWWLKILSIFSCACWPSVYLYWQNRSSA